MIGRSAWKRMAIDALGPTWSVRARCLLRGKPLPRWGNLRRTRPFSTEFGSDRGTPIDRYYLDQFLAKHRRCITGRVLEIQMSAYTRRFGVGVMASDTIDINPQFQPTYLCDLSHAEHVVPDDSYDCVLLPSTLQHLREIEPALINARRIVKPGGVILATAAGFVPLIPDGGDYWRLTAAGWRELTSRVWPAAETEIVAYGNTLAAMAALYGITVEELTPAELDVCDPRIPVLIALRCTKE